MNALSVNFRPDADHVGHSLASPKVGLMKLTLVKDEYRYAVAVREGSNLRLTLWTRRSRKGEIFVMLPRGDRHWDPHTSKMRDALKWK